MIDDFLDGFLGCGSANRGPRARTQKYPTAIRNGMLLVWHDTEGTAPDHEVLPPELPDVMTDAYTSAWVPSQKPFMTVTVTFENVRGKTRYTARVRHWSVADRETHEKMGFHQGWGQCTDQLAEVAAKL